MYICARGRLEVVADEGKTILATLKAGSYFGEISILNMGTAGNRRTASVRSVGYSDLFVLSKKDMWDVLKDYPAARVRLEAIAVKRLEKYKKAPLEKAALPRSESTPGLVESSGIVPLEVMWVSPLPLYSPRDSPESTSKGGAICYRPNTDSPLSEFSSTRSQSTLGGHRCPVDGGGPHHSHQSGPGGGHRHQHHKPRSRRTSVTGHHSTLPLPITQVTAPTPTLHDFPPSPPQGGELTSSGCCQSPASAFGSSSFAPGGSGHPENPATSYHVCRRQNNHAHLPYNGGGSMSSSGSQILASFPDHGQFPVTAIRRPSHEGTGGGAFQFAQYAGPAPNQQQTYQVPPTIHLPHHYHQAPPAGPSSASTSGKKSNPPKEELLLEIRRLRERIKVLEGDNATMHLSLSKTQKDVDQRLAEIEMQIGEEDETSSSVGASVSCSLNSGEEEEKNRESFI
eukprot:maker-scaffold474_size162001-snap-gene-0.36 protein:Tk10287 transcript:maker-scaffold474_size162001-snap-gene-0.36-mRNA-1 annotation:"cyclic-nucleotide-gated cation"